MAHQSLSPDPLISDAAPADKNFTGCDQQYLITYLRLLDVDAEGTGWQEVAKIVLRVDPEREPDWAKCSCESYSARANWMTKNGFRHLLRGGAPY